MVDRQALHTLVDELPEPELPAARRYLEYLRWQPPHPLRLVLDQALLDEEPVTADDLAAFEKASRRRPGAKPYPTTR
jgi:hypothetical protein